MKDLPLYYRVARAWTLPGRHRIFSALERLGFLDRVGPFPFYDQTVLAPLYLRALSNMDNISEQYGRRLRNLVQVAGESIEEPILVDGGADLGFMSLLLARHTNVRRIIAIEPNPRSYDLLKVNLELSGRPFEAIHGAVSDFDGGAELILPDFQRAHQAAFISRDNDGPVRVFTIDSLDVPAGRDLLLKLDVEGEEAAALRGAARTIGSARRACLFVELHREVLARSGQTPEDVFGAVKRPVTWFNAADMSRLDPGLRFFDQVEPALQYDVIGRTDVP